MKSVRSGFGPGSEQAIWAIREVKALLDSYQQGIHSIILVGSYASGEARKHSDADFLVLLKRGREERRISRILFELQLDHWGSDPRPVKLQIVPFKEIEIQHLFELSAPLTHSARHGVVIRDDGWFQTLRSRPYPPWPTRDYSVEAFTRWIVWQYYLSAVELQREIHRDHGPEGFCTKKGYCLNHSRGDILARVISRMLYVTLPARGLLPLSKRQAVTMALESYGPRARRSVMLAMAVLRKERGISFREFRTLFPFAREIFRECLDVCGSKDPRVLGSLRDHARIYRDLDARRRRLLAEG